MNDFGNTPRLVETEGKKKKPTEDKQVEQDWKKRVEESLARSRSHKKLVV